MNKNYLALPPHKKAELQKLGSGLYETRVIVCQLPEAVHVCRAAGFEPKVLFPKVLAQDGSYFFYGQIVLRWGENL